jgi:hypothetical protein
LDVVYYIRRKANLADAPSRQRGLDMWSLQQPTQQEPFHLLGRVDVGLAGLHRPLRLAECCGYKIRHSAPLPSECSFQRLAPRLVAARHALAKPAMASTASSFGKTSSVKGKRYPCLPLLACPFFSLGFKKCSGFQPSTSACRLLIFASDRIIQVWLNFSSIDREVQLRAVVFDCA